MSAVHAWFMSAWINLAIGFVAGWIVFERPQWATDLFNKLKGKVGL